MTTRKLPMFIFLCFASGLLAAQTNKPRIGSPAPPISVGNWLTDGNAQSLAEKTIVLEFWATWCAPCIGAIPHLNELAEKFTRRNIMFVSITPEDEPLVRKFLKTHSMKSSVVTDNHGETHRSYGVESIPQFSH